MEMMQTLKSNNVTFVNPHEVPICQEKGVPVLDVRTAEQYSKVCRYCVCHLHGSQLTLCGSDSLRPYLVAAIHAMWMDTARLSYIQMAVVSILPFLLCSPGLR